jgi:hypothetical protein
VLENRGQAQDRKVERPRTAIKRGD